VQRGKAIFLFQPDEDTLLRHKALWVDENEQHPAAELTLLTAAEQGL
jgi:hypothetical protein